LTRLPALVERTSTPITWRATTVRRTPAVEEVALLQRLGLTSSSIVIDVGAGTGQFTLAVAPVSGHVVAVDVSPVMLELLRVKVGRMGLGTSRWCRPASSPTTT